MFKKWFQRANKKKRIKSEPNHRPSSNDSLSARLSVNVQKIKEISGNSPDITIRWMEAGAGGEWDIAVVYINGLADSNTVNNVIVKSLMQETEKEAGQSWMGVDVLSLIKKRVLTVGGVGDIHDMDQLLSSLFSGDTIILVEGYGRGLSAGTLGWEHRGVEEPQSQTVIRGPKEGFTENLTTNTALLRRKIQSPQLWMEMKKIGRVTQTKVAVMYLKGVANEKVVAEVMLRLDRIDTDSILEGGYIEEFIQDATFTPFPTIANTERPDAVAGAILEGQIAILVDGTPFVLLAPVTFFKFFQSSEDYYHRYDISTFIRIMRYTAFIVSMLLPSLYIAVTTYHQEMLPTTLLISLMAQREGIPFPAFVEALIMEVTFEVLREAGVRMPRAIGPAISIVGALVLGQAAVQAGLVSAGMVIIVSFTAISNFVAPAFNIAIAARLLRFFFMVLAATLGLFGIMAGLIAVLIHMAGLRSFGVPYLTPMAPFIPANQKDVLVRVPWWAMFTRPRLISQHNSIRQGKNLKPSPHEEKEEFESEKD
ncbi:spore germination protein [Ammoniphilus sp. 3BR4]|uniref:spore germination protein n=1 Tax=Ammoniphilus sp. 3BR4 TaxID=3158265 RepID=UPI0034653375